MRIKTSTGGIEPGPEAAVLYLRTVLGEVGGVMMEMSRMRSAGAVVCLWEAKTLGARLYFARGLAGDMDLAVTSLPSIEEVKPLINRSLAIYYYEGLRQYAMTRAALQKKDFKNSQELSLVKIFDFLKINNKIKIKFAEVNKRKYHSKISKSEKNLLYEIYKNDITKTEKILDWDCSDWKDLK